jgi:hypothetical protein
MRSLKTAVFLTFFLARSLDLYAAGVARVAEGTLLHRQDKTWKVLPPSQEIEPGDLLLAFPEGSVDSANGAVRLSLKSNFSQRGFYPIQESAIRLASQPDFDFGVVLERGRIDISNRKKEGPAKVLLRFHNQEWELTLAHEARVAVELYGRWMPGARFKKEATSDEGPAADLMLIVVSGTANVKAHGNRFGLRAPPGVALLHWDSQSPEEVTPKQLAELPGWVSPKLALAVTRGALLFAAQEAIRKRILAGERISKILEDNLHDNSPSARGIAVFGLGATDELARLIDALADAKYSDVRDLAVVALRHWIGRGTEEDRHLHETLIQKQKYPANQAEIVMQLLHGFDTNDLARPATYEILIEYLMHDQPAIRQLAQWHLRRLVPAGRSIPHDPTATAEDRHKAQECWKKLVPDGKVPENVKSP